MLCQTESTRSGGHEEARPLGSCYTHICTQTQNHESHITVYAVMHKYCAVPIWRSISTNKRTHTPMHMPFLSDLISVNHRPAYQACQMHLNTASSSCSSTVSPYPLLLALFRSCFMHAAGQWIIPYAETIFFASPRSPVKAERANRGNKSQRLGFGTCRSAVSRSYGR